VDTERGGFREVTPDQFQVKITMEVVKKIARQGNLLTTDPETDEVKKLEVDSERRASEPLETETAGKDGQVDRETLRQAHGYKSKKSFSGVSW
jgi:hypothetical protein